MKKKSKVIGKDYDKLEKDNLCDSDQPDMSWGGELPGEATGSGAREWDTALQSECGIDPAIYRQSARSERLGGSPRTIRAI